MITLWLDILNVASTASTLWASCAQNFKIFFNCLFIERNMLISGPVLTSLKIHSVCPFAPYIYPKSLLNHFYCHLCSSYIYNEFSLWCLEYQLESLLLKSYQLYCIVFEILFSPSSDLMPKIFHRLLFWREHNLLRFIFIWIISMTRRCKIDLVFFIIKIVLNKKQ